MAENLMKLEIITPERIFYQGDVSMVELTTTEGEVGIYPKHIPMTMIIAPGILTVTESDGTKKQAALMKGFLEITQDSMNILAEVIEWPEEIDADRVRQSKERAQKRLNEKQEQVDLVRAEMAMRRALVREKLIE
ncbi:ATP synthase F1 subunit epsilon [Anaerostipes sp. MSJ-23]|uniref:ATP synthase F1 subunit epsilon n=1 Tax=unclassified Anaerostipes TaxID=2635253 RepID=UPI001C111EF3|nr:ATP synthase F1 subunit epsilon [Anaerostipes sp. MSJ-23]MBU5459635.1 ATP synthase F1 subunit epsilon [Anaerostipes sp. MSJ-23]